MQFRTVTLLALLAVALCARAGDAQTSRAAQTSRVARDGASATAVEPSAPADEATEPKTIRRPADAPKATSRPAGTTKSPAVGFETGRVVLSLAVVITLIFALRWLSQRMFGKAVAGRASRAVQVLSRNVISPKQQLLIVQVGRRLLVVGDSGQQMHPLCEITDPEEMAALIGQLHEEKRESSGNMFGTVFGRAGSDFAEKRNAEPPRPVGVADEDEDEEDGHSTGPSGVDETRDELGGLMDKVRGMSRQFRRT